MQENNQRRCIILCLILVAGLSCLSARLIQIQIVDRTKYSSDGRSSYRRETSIAHRRGVIIDRNDEVISHDIPLKSIYVDKYHLKDPNVASRSLGCKYLRDVLEKDPSSAEYKQAIKYVDGVLKPKDLKRAYWKAITPKRRLSLVKAASRKLLDAMPDEELRTRNVEFIAKELDRGFGVSEENLAGLLDLKSKKKMNALVKKDLSLESASELQNLLNDFHIRGFEARDVVRRECRFSQDATHTTGYVDHTRKGKAGVEGKWNSHLEGRDGRETRFADIRGEIIPGEGETLPPKHGKDVRLTIDMKMQAVVEDELQKGMDYYKCAKGAIVVMDPKTGEILAMASRPHYDLNNREGIVENGFNYAIQASNETGSTIKIVATAAAMNEGKATYDTEVDCGWGILRDRGFTVKDHHPYGKLTLWGVLMKSSNTGAWQFAKMIGAKKFYEYAELFGYGKRTGVGLVGESRGKVGNTGNRMDFSRACYGYVLTASPLQIAAAYSTIANDGVYIPPYIVKDVLRKDGQAIYSGSTSPRVVNGTHRVLKTRVAKDMQRALLQVTTDKGTARRARVKGYIVGGKTGTNHKIDPKTKHYDRDKYITSFAGMCPAEDPNFVCVVVMDDPRLVEVWDEKKQKLVTFKRGGGSVAAPIFSKLVKRIAPLRGLQPKFEESN